MFICSRRRFYRSLYQKAVARLLVQETLEELSHFSPYAKFKETVLRGDGKSASVSFLEGDCKRRVERRDGRLSVDLKNDTRI